MTDQQIVKALFARAEIAISALSERFGALLWQISKNILDNDRDAEECVNDTYLALWNAIPPTRPESLCAYVCRTGRNLALKRLRKNEAAKRNTSYDLSLDELAEYLSGPDPETECESHDVGRALNRFLDRQPSEQRIMFLRRYWFGDSVKDIARRTGRTENSVSVSLSRTRDKLKIYLEKEGLLK